MVIFDYHLADVLIFEEIVMTFLSSFELLFEPIIPQPPNIISGQINPTGAPDPLVIQSFFALISNIGSSAATLQLAFTASNEYNLKFTDTFAVFDTNNQKFTAITPSIITNATTTTAVVNAAINPGVTGIFLLQPNIAFFQHS